MLAPGVRCIDPPNKISHTAHLLLLVSPGKERRTEGARRLASCTARPVIMGTQPMVSAGHYLATAAGVRMLEAGGKVMDAGVATGLCITA